MKRLTRQIRTLMPKCALITLLLLFAATSVQGEYQEVIQKTFDVKEGGLLKVHSALGSIEISTGPGNKVEVEITQIVKRLSDREAKKLLNDFNIYFNQLGNTVEITTDLIKNKWNPWNNVGRHLRLKYKIRVPAKFNLDLQTSGGSIVVDNLEGEVVAKTSGGSLKFGRIQGPVSAKTSGGSITLEECQGTAKIATSGGHIKLGRVDGEVSARTSGGSIRIEQAKGSVIAKTSGGSITVNEVKGTIQASTSGGSITAHITEQPQSDCRLTTSGGSISVYLKPDIRVTLDASTSGGRVNSELPITVQGTIRKNKLQGKINGGGPELYLRTSGGSIYIREI